MGAVLVEVTAPIIVDYVRCGAKIPGPTWFCPICKNQVNAKHTSVRCTGCNNWCHMKRCTNQTSTKDWKLTFRASCCAPSQSQNQNVPNSTVVQSTSQTTTYNTYNVA